MVMIMLAVIQGLEEVIVELESKIRNLDHTEGWKQGYWAGQRDACKSVVDKLREICL